MTTYKLITLDDDGNTINIVPMDIGTLDGVLVFQLDADLAMTDAEIWHIKAQLQEAFPDRRVLILMPGIHFVRFVPVEDTL